MDPRQVEWFHKNLRLGKDWLVDDIVYRVTPMRVTVHVSFIGTKVCPKCGRPCPGYDTREREWRDLDHGNSKCNVIAKVPRVSCKDCGVHEINISWAGSCSNLTRSLERRVLDAARSTHIAGIASQFGVQPRTVWRIVKYYTNEMMRDIDLSSLRIVSLDETSCNKGRKYVSHFIDHDCGAVVFCTEGNDGTVLSAFRFWLIHHNCDPDAIRVFCCDMSRAYISGIRMFFPKAAICFDPFHVIQHANVTLDSIRRKSGIKGKAGKGLRFGYLMNKEDLESKDEEYKERIVETLHSYRWLGIAYALKEALRDFYNVGNARHAGYFLKYIYMYCLKSENEDIVSLGKMLENHYDGIVMWHTHKSSNGYAEGTNSVIQAMKATARGYPNVDSLIAMIYLRSSVKHPSLKPTFSALSI